MNHFNAVIRAPRIEKMRKLFLFGLIALLVIAVFWYWNGLMSLVIELQRTFHAQLATHIRAVGEDTATYGWGLVGLSFAYGVFHAVGPGHGKAVIATYLGTHRESIRKGIGISMASALLQALVAITLVSVTVNLLRLRFADIDNYGEEMALVSYILVMLLGLVLSLSAIRRLFRLKSSSRLAQLVARSRNDQHQADHHDHDHDHDHQHHDAHAADHCGCNHALVPDANHSWWQTLAVIFSVGVRPCSGAIVVLIYAHLVGVFHYGIAATLFMGLGTGLSVSAIALGSQYARHWLESMLSNNDDGNRVATNHAVLGISVRLAGGALLILMGWGLYRTALQSSMGNPLF
ncbi:MAG: nickel/cobalt transporter [Gammaproteobacteria bacterium]|nr:nickel/cobalt transporter [Gammaproteobacteria bacterium]